MNASPLLHQLNGREMETVKSEAFLYSENRSLQFKRSRRINYRRRMPLRNEEVKYTKI
jgi:hypothetical protein